MTEARGNGDEIETDKTHVRRCLWEDPFKNSDSKRATTTITTEAFIHSRLVVRPDMSPYLSKPKSNSILFMVHSALSVGQELCLACLLILGHREIAQSLGGRLVEGAEERQIISLAFICATILLTLLFSMGDGGEETYNRDDNKYGNNSNDEDVSSSNQSNKEKSSLGHSGNKSPRSGQVSRRRDRVAARFTDSLLLAAILRLLASVLRTLTASYSSDTVMALAIGGLVVHVLACDYRYANGLIRAKNNTGSSSRGTHVVVGAPHGTRSRPTFQGGTMSLNAALFSTTLLSSRLPAEEAGAAVYMFVSSSVAMFAFYPLSRHAVAANFRARQQFPSTQNDHDDVNHTGFWTFITSPCLLVTICLILSIIPLLRGSSERGAFAVVILSACIFVPMLKWRLQRYKRIICGPWDIAHISVQD